MTQTATSTYGKVLETALADFDRIARNRSAYHPSAFYLLCEEIRMSLPDFDSPVAEAVFRSMENAVARKQQTGKFEEFFELMFVPEKWVDIGSYMKRIGCRAFLLPPGTPNGMEHAAALCKAGWDAGNYYALEDGDMVFLGVVFSRKSDE